MGDFFSRKGLLSTAQRAKIAPLPARAEAPKESSDVRAKHPAIAPPALLADGETEVFERTTLVPSLPAEAHAKALMAALDGSLSNASRPTPKAPVTLSFSSMELAFDENPTALGFIEAQKRRPGDELDEAFEPRPSPLPSRAEPRRAVGLEELYEVGDFTAALELAETRLRADPGDGVAQNYRNRCHDRLVQMLMARVGRLDAKVEMLVPSDQLRWLSVDHRAGFVISLVDGTATLDEILDVAGMPRLEALRILADLKERGVIGVVR